MQMPHKYAHGEDFEFHVHLAYPEASTGKTAWDMTLAGAAIGSTFGNLVTVSALQVTAPNELDHHQLAEIAEITGYDAGVASGVSKMFLGSLKRIAANTTADTFGTAVYLVAADFHVPIDMLGSRDKASK